MASADQLQVKLRHEVLRDILVFGRSIETNGGFVQQQQYGGRWGFAPRHQGLAIGTVTNSFFMITSCPTCAVVGGSKACVQFFFK
jgi:hypothetical protein